MTGLDWVEAFAERIGVDPPDEETVETLLALAGTAAHASERLAAPLACWLAARAGLDAGAALSVARELSDAAGDGGGG